MDPLETARSRVGLVPGLGGRKRHLVHPFNARFCAVDHEALEGLVRVLAARVDMRGVDYVVGSPEGGSIPAYAFGRAVGCPVVLTSRLPVDMPGTITFEQPQAGLGTTHYLYGVGSGRRVLIVEDELTNGRMAVNAVRAFRAAGLAIDQIVTLFAIDHPVLWRRMEAERITLHVGVTLPPEYAPRLLDDQVE